MIIIIIIIIIIIMPLMPSCHHQCHHHLPSFSELNSISRSGWVHCSNIYSLQSHNATQSGMQFLLQFSRYSICLEMIPVKALTYTADKP